MEIRNKELLKAATIAAIRHAGQVDKAGEPYIAHVTRVALRGTTYSEKFVGFLHDIFEDTGYTFWDLNGDFPGIDGNVESALFLLTRNPDVPYSTYIEDLAVNPLARLVKINDLKDHLENNLDAIPASLHRRYVKAMGQLTP